MGLPSILERAILMGYADFRTISHAFGTFGSIPIPDNSTVIITSVKWFPFLSPIKIIDKRTGADITTWRDLFRYSEYQLKIEGKKSKNFLQYRNAFDFTWFTGEPSGTSAQTLDNLVNYSLLSSKLLPKQHPPIIQDVYFVCEEYVKLTITRNAYVSQIAPVSGFVAASAIESPTPSGVKDMSVLLKDGLLSPGLKAMVYYPPNTENSGVYVANQRNTENYKQDYDADYSGISEIKTSSGSWQSKFPYHTSPLVEFGIVTINNQHFDSIKNQ